jgi:hypothetical protein
MKRTIFTILTLITLSASVLQGQKIAIDKQLHIGAGAVVGAWGTLIPQDQKGIKPFVFGIGASAIAGAGKEIVDLGGFGTPDIKDFGATVIGGIISVGMVQGVKAIVHTVKKHKSYTGIAPTRKGKCLVCK